MECLPLYPHARLHTLNGPESNRFVPVKLCQLLYLNPTSDRAIVYQSAPFIPKAAMHVLTYEYYLFGPRPEDTPFAALQAYGWHSGAGYFGAQASITAAVSPA